MSQVIWGPHIVLYSFITGLVLGSYMTSTLSTIFKKKEFENISIYSLIIAWAFLLASPIPLILDLGSPFKAPNIFTYPTASSAMALFGYVWLIFVILLTGQIILYVKYRDKPWFQRVFPTSSAVGLVLALVFGGYLGFIIGSMKAREVWSSTLTPITTILSGLTAGVALVILLTILTLKLDGVKRNTLNSLNKYALYFLSLYLVFTLVELLTTTYANPLTWNQFAELLSGYFTFSFIGVQYIIGGLVPVLMLALTKIRTSWIGSIISSLLILAGVYAYKWNLIIGGQLIIEASPQLYTIITFTPTQMEILAAIGVLSLGGFLYVLGLTIFPVKEWSSGR